MRRRDPRRPPPRQGRAPAGRQRPARSTRSGSPTRTASRSTTPPPRTGSPTRMVRDAETGELRAASWPEAFAVAARGLQAAGGVGVLTGGRLTREDAYAYAKFARVALGTNDIDFRSRPHTDEEAQFLAARVAGRGRRRDLRRPRARHRRRPARPRARGGGRHRCSCGCARPPAGEGPRIFAVAPFTTRGLRKLKATVVRTAPGDEVAAIEAARPRRRARARRRRRHPRRRAARRPCPARSPPPRCWPTQTGARLAWVPAPRRRPRSARRRLPRRRCCPAAVRSPTPTRASTSAPCGAPRCPHRDRPRRRRRSSPPPPTGELGAPRRRRRRARRPGRPGRRRAPRCDAAGFVVSLELRASAVTELRRRRLPGRPGRGEVRQLRELGGPRPALRQGPHREQRASPTSGCSAGIAEELGPPARLPDPARPPPPSSTSSGPGTVPAPRTPTWSRQARRRREPRLDHRRRRTGWRPGRR